MLVIKENENLSIYGVGPLFTWPVVAVSLICAVIFGFGNFDFGKVKQYGIVFVMIGVVLMVLAVLLYTSAVFKAKIVEHIRNDKLLTTGVYAYVRNPIYSAVLFMCLGIIVIARNYCLLCLPVIYWVYLTVLLKKTEEIWLEEYYGQQFLDYCKKTNRCIPWIPRR